MDATTQVLINLAGIALAQWIGSIWIKSRIESSIKHEYDRQLEEFKTNLVIASEVAKKRVQIVGESWAKIVEYEAAWVRQQKRLSEFFLQELRRQNAPNLPEELPGDLMARLKVLADFPELGETGDLEARIEEHMRETHRVLMEQSYELVGFIAKNRFWLGRELEGELHSYVDDVTEAFASLSPVAEDRKAFMEKAKRLAEKRAEATRILPRLLKGTEK